MHTGVGRICYLNLIFFKPVSCIYKVRSEFLKDYFIIYIY
nr:MAG TPA: hypothetical protein [Caudoviricetes sp.]